MYRDQGCENGTCAAGVGLRVKPFLFFGCSRSSTEILRGSKFIRSTLTGLDHRGHQRPGVHKWPPPGYERFMIIPGLRGQTITKVFLMWTPRTVAIRFLFPFPVFLELWQLWRFETSKGQGLSKTWSGTSNVPLRPLLLLYSILWIM